jgi:serine/threonine protein kinase
VIKFVDFGAAKILAKNHRTMIRSRRPAEGLLGGGLGVGLSSSLTGTPMYMSPEVIKNDTRGRHGAMDIWSMGCVVLEFATGKKPWSHLDNEWYVSLAGVEARYLEHILTLLGGLGRSCITSASPLSIHRFPSRTS